MSERPSFLKRLGRALDTLTRATAHVLFLGLLVALVALAVAAYR
jgi:hypothetical protein